MKFVSVLLLSTLVCYSYGQDCFSRGAPQQGGGYLQYTVSATLQNQPITNNCEQSVCAHNGAGGNAGLSTTYSLTSTEATLARTQYNCSAYQLHQCPAASTYDIIDPKFGGCPRCSCIQSQDYEINYVQTFQNGKTCNIYQCADVTRLHTGTNGDFSCYNSTAKGSSTWAWVENSEVLSGSFSLFGANPGSLTDSVGATSWNEFSSTLNPNNCSSNTVATPIFNADMCKVGTQAPFTYYQKGALSTTELGLIATGLAQTNIGWQPVNHSGVYHCTWQRCAGNDQWTRFDTSVMNTATGAIPIATRAEILSYPSCRANLALCINTPTEWRFMPTVSANINYGCRPTGGNFCASFYCERSCAGRSKDANNNTWLITGPDDKGNYQCSRQHCNNQEMMTLSTGTGSAYRDMALEIPFATQPEYTSGLVYEAPYPLLASTDVNAQEYNSCPPQKVAMYQNANAVRTFKYCKPLDSSKRAGGLVPGIERYTWDPQASGISDRSYYNYGCLYNSTCVSLGANKGQCQYAQITYTPRSVSVTSKVVDSIYATSTTKLCNDYIRQNPFNPTPQGFAGSNPRPRFADVYGGGDGCQTQPWFQELCTSESAPVTKLSYIQCFNNSMENVYAPPTTTLTSGASGCVKNQRLTNALQNYWNCQYDTTFIKEYQRGWNCNFPEVSNSASLYYPAQSAYQGMCSNTFTNYLKHKASCVCSYIATLNGGADLSSGPGNPGYIYAARKQWYDLYTSVQSSNIQTLRDYGCDLDIQCDVTNGAVTVTGHEPEISVQTEIPLACNMVNEDNVKSAFQSGITSYASSWGNGGSQILMGANSAPKATFTDGMIGSVANNNRQQGCIVDLKMRVKSAAFAYAYQMYVNSGNGFGYKYSIPMSFNNGMVKLNNYTSTW